MQNKVMKNLFKPQQLGLSVYKGNHIDTKRALHLGVLVEGVYNNLGNLITLKLNDYPHTVPVGLVAKV